MGHRNAAPIRLSLGDAPNTCSAAARNKGTCGNRLNIRVDAVEASVVSGLRTHLMDPMLFTEFCEEFTREVNRLRIEKSASLHAAKAELPRITRELDKLIQRVLDTDDLTSIKAYEKKMRELESRKADLEALIANMDEPPPLLHPNMAEIYRSRVAALHEALLRDETKAEAAETIRAWRAGDRAEGRSGRDAELCRRQEKARHRSESRAFWRFWIAGERSET